MGYMDKTDSFIKDFFFHQPFACPGTTAGNPFFIFIYPKLIHFICIYLYFIYFHFLFFYSHFNLYLYFLFYLYPEDFLFYQLGPNPEPQNEILFRTPCTSRADRGVSLPGTSC